MPPISWCSGDVDCSGGGGAGGGGGDDDDNEDSKAHKNYGDILCDFPLKSLLSECLNILILKNIKQILKVIINILSVTNKGSSLNDRILLFSSFTTLHTMQRPHFRDAAALCNGKKLRGQ